ncbi:MAG: porin [Nitrospirae bacterium]|nr:porin [Nitrospirota bacterium]
MRQCDTQLAIVVICLFLLSTPLQAADKDDQKISDKSLEQVQNGLDTDNRDTGSVPVDAKLLRQLQQTIQQQQQQIRQQAAQIMMQSERLDAMQQQINALQRNEQSQTPAAVASATKKQQPDTASLQDPLPWFTISSGNDLVKLSLSGQVNRAVTIVHDGRKTGLYPVDNSTSGSRVRFIGTAKIDDDLSVGTRIEVTVAPDTSAQVSQTSPTPGTYFDQRWAEFSLTSVKYGKLSLGKGDTASNSTAEVDLSRTDVVQYASIADIASGMLFREKRGTNALTTLKVSDVFQDRDGLSRQSRLRYDTPTYCGFSLAVSLVTDQRYDAGIFWYGEGHGLKAAGAFAISDPNLPDSGLQYDGSLSVLHQNTGLNLTLSGGLQERVRQKAATNLYGKVGWIADLNKLGNTAFGIDYTRSENLPSPRDSAWSVGATAVQFVTRIATEFYIQYRNYALDRQSGPAVENIIVSTVGARVKF